MLTSCGGLFFVFKRVMAVELKNRVEAELVVDLPLLKVLAGASLRHLASMLRERSGIAAG
jgi:hypothetical protein